jgi:tetratricopeptide (TPR) repeat protein
MSAQTRISRLTPLLSARWFRLAALVAGAALLVDLAVVAVLHFRRPPLPPALPVFNSPLVIRELQAAAAEMPRDPEWHLRLGLAYLEDGHYLSAIESLNAALALNAPELAVRSALAACYSNLERNEEAVEQLLPLAGDGREGVKARLQLAREYARLDRVEKALEVLAELPALAEDLPAAGDRRRALVELASAYGELGRWDSCLRTAEAVLRQEVDVDARLLAARALLQLDRAEESARYSRAVLQSRPDDSQAMFLRAQALLSLDRHAHRKELRQLLEAVTRAREAPGQALFELGLIYEAEQEWALAADAFTRAHGVRTSSLRSLQHAYENFQKAGLRE